LSSPYPIRRPVTPHPSPHPPRSPQVYSSWTDSAKSISDLKFSPDGKCLAAGSMDGNIYVYALNDDNKTFRRQGALPI
jgi:hypothetical protein